MERRRMGGEMMEWSVRVGGSVGKVEEKGRGCNGREGVGN